jgi:hypothetical protein
VRHSRFICPPKPSCAAWHVNTRHVLSEVNYAVIVNIPGAASRSMDIQRRKFSKDVASKGLDVSDTSWLEPSGEEMSDESWNAGFRNA